MPERIVSVLVKPGSKQRRIEASADGKTLTVWTPKPPAEGKANMDVVDIIAEHFRVPKSCVKLRRGGTSKRKIFKIMA